jgi:putative sterol carrier protein
MTQSPPATGEELQNILRRTVELLNDKLDPPQLERIASAFQTVRWEFNDLDTAVHLVSDQAGPALRYASSIEGEPSVSIGMSSKTLDDAAWGHTSFGTAFITGKLKVKGLHPLKMSKFASMLDPFLASYREAQEEANGG